MNIFLRVSLILVIGFSSQLQAGVLSEQRLVFKSINESNEYRLTLSALKTVNANLVAEREVLISGRVERFTYEFVSDLNYHEAWSLLAKELHLASYRELFSCDALNCGSSNAWANKRFGIKQLYGLDQTQKYRAYALDTDQGVEYFVLYFIQRGNKRIYAQIDKIHSKNAAQHIAESSTTIAGLIEAKGYYSVLSRDQKTFTAQQVTLLSKALKSKPFTRFYLVGHCSDAAGFEESLRCGEDSANKLGKLLIQSGVPQKRFEIKTVGGLAPRYKVPENRVEVVVKGVKR